MPNVIAVAVAYFLEVTLVAAWCELRSDYRHFRADRIAALTVLDETFADDGGELLQGWLVQRSRDYPEQTAAAAGVGWMGADAGPRS
jgi:predicted DNA-binding transcriptional regulator YafY